MSSVGHVTLLLRHPVGMWNFIDQVMLIDETFCIPFSTQNSQVVSYYTRQ